MIDGASSDVTVSRTDFYSALFQDAVLAKPGAQQVTLTTNLLDGTSAESGFTLDGTTGAAVTSNTLLVECAGVSATHTAVALADGSSGTVENNVLEPVAGSACATPTAGLSVDASWPTRPAGSRPTTTPSTQKDRPPITPGRAPATTTRPPSPPATTGQGAHDVTLPTAFSETPPEGSPAINSADCSAPGELSTDFHGQPWLRDPLAADASLGNGSCYASRGAFARQDSLPLAFTAPPLNSAGYPAGAVPFTTGVTITGDATSAWGEPVSYTVDFGDGSPPVPATPGAAVTHTYTTAGQYTITITAADTSGMTDSDNLQPVYALPDQPPTAGLSAAPAGLGTTVGIQPDTAVFAASPGSTGWEIGDTAMNYGGAGDASETGDPSTTWEYTYGEPGTYTATLTVTDKLGRRPPPRPRSPSATSRRTCTPSPTTATRSRRTGWSRSRCPSWTRTTAAPAARWSTSASPARRRPATSSSTRTGRPGPTCRPCSSSGRAAENSTLATGGTVDFYNGSAGTVNLQIVTYGIDTIMTTNGYGAYGETYAPVTPVTVLQDRGRGRSSVTFRWPPDHVPANAEDVVLDVTASGGSTAGASSPRPRARTETVSGHHGYWAKGQQVTNLVMESPGGGKVELENAGPGSAYFSASVVGYYLFTGSESVFLPPTPRRLGTVSIPANRSVTLAVAGQNGIPATGTTAVALDLTASESPRPAPSSPTPTAPPCPSPSASATPPAPRSPTPPSPRWARTAPSASTTPGPSPSPSTSTSPAPTTPTPDVDPSVQTASGPPQAVRERPSAVSRADHRNRACRLRRRRRSAPSGRVLSADSPHGSRSNCQFSRGASSRWHGRLRRNRLADRDCSLIFISW